MKTSIHSWSEDQSLWHDNFVTIQAVVVHHQTFTMPPPQSHRPLHSMSNNAAKHKCHNSVDHNHQDLPLPRSKRAKLDLDQQQKQTHHQVSHSSSSSSSSLSLLYSSS